MPRTARIVLPDTPHHVIQRGNRRQRTFFSEADYRLYLRIAAEAFAEAQVQIWGYCLMPNHVHLIAVPADDQGLAQAVGATHLRYTRIINQREDWRGYLWQGRFASFPMDEAHLLNCARYIALNPVRAGLVAQARAWPWSSVRAHCDGRPDALVMTAPLLSRLGDQINAFFDEDAAAPVQRDLRRSAGTGRPLGSGAWLKAIEAKVGRSLDPPRLGRPPRRAESRDTHAFPRTDEAAARWL